MQQFQGYVESTGWLQIFGYRYNENINPRRKYAMYTRELTLALSLAEKAGDIQMHHQNTPIQIHYKEDTSPVTAVDRECETLIRSAITEKFPEDAFLGEESGKQSGTSGRCWIVDPLDGTRPFIRGIPTFSTLIALETDGHPVVGVIHLPALGKTCWAAKGHGAFCNGRPIHVSTTPTLKDAVGSALGYLEHEESDLRQSLLTFMGALGYHYGFMDAFSYACLAEGKLDVCVNVLDKPWDCAAAACIVSEAGGTFTDITGTASVHNGSIILSNGILHEQTFDFFRNFRNN